MGFIGGIAAGTYSFIVRAANDMGSDTQACALEVTAATTPAIKSISFTQPASRDSDTKLTQANSGIKVLKPFDAEIIPLATSAKPQVTQNPTAITLKADLFKDNPPPNKLTLRCDDPKDVYTHDRNTLSGAYYICWDSSIALKIVTVMVDTSLGKTESDYTTTM